MDFPVPQEHSFWSRCWYDFRRKNTAWIASLSLQMAGMEFEPEDAQTKLTMDYFKEKKLLQIHK